MKAFYDQNAVIAKTDGIRGIAFHLLSDVEIKERGNDCLAVQKRLDIPLDPLDIQCVNSLEVRPSLFVALNILDVVVVVER